MRFIVSQIDTRISTRYNEAMDIQAFWGIPVGKKAGLAIRLAARPSGTTMGEIKSHNGQAQHNVFKRLEEVGHTVIRDGTGSECLIKLRHKDNKRFKDDEIKTLNTDTTLHMSSRLVKQRELELQKTLRKRISELENDLCIADNGRENSFRDITCSDSKGKKVIIELKVVKATKDAVAQTLAYMGESVASEGIAKSKIRGILVAPDFQDKTIYAARMTPNVRLYRYTLKPLKFERIV